MKKIKGFKTYISSFAISSVEQPVISDMADKDIISCKYVPLTDTWRTQINTDKISKDATYHEFTATFTDCINALQIADYSIRRTDIRFERYAKNFDKDMRLNILLISLFNIAVNETGEDIAGIDFFRYHDEIASISASNKYWEIWYHSERQDGNSNIVKTCLELRSLNTTKKGGRKPHELKKLWFKKLDQIPVIYEYLKIRRFYAGEDYMCNKDLMKLFSKADLEAYIEKIKAAMNSYYR